MKARENNRLKPAIYESTRAPLTSHPLSFLPVEGCPCGADLSSAFGAPLLQGAARLACKSAAYKNTAFPRIVISSESEKSFPFAVKPRMREQRITGNAMLHMNWKLRCFLQTDSHRKEETRSRKRSLGSARDDDTGKRTISHSPFILLRSQPPPLRGTSFQGKEVEYTLSPAPKAFPAWGRWRA